MGKKEKIEAGVQISYMCKTKCFFQGRIHNPDKVYEFSSEVKVPKQHFMSLGPSSEREMTPEKMVPILLDKIREMESRLSDYELKELQKEEDPKK